MDDTIEKTNKMRTLAFDQYWVKTKDPTYEELKFHIDDLLEKQSKNSSRQLIYWNIHMSKRQQKIDGIQTLIKDIVLEHIENCPFTDYEPFTWWCYFLANHLRNTFWWELYSNVDHVILKLYWMYFDRNGIVDFTKQDDVKFIPIDWDEEKRYKKTLQS